MKLPIFLSLLTLTGAFQAPRPLQPASLTTKLYANPMEQILRGLANNFEPLHGRGSLEDDLDEQWEAQQEILRQRRLDNLDKDHLKKKYKNPEQVKFDGKVGDSKKSSFTDKLSPWPS